MPGADHSPDVSDLQLPRFLLRLDRVIPSDSTLLDDTVGDITAELDATACWGVQEPDVETFDLAVRGGNCQCNSSRSRVVLVDEQRILVHGQQREPGIVMFRDGAPRPVFINRAELKFFVMASETHCWYFFNKFRAMINRCSSLVPPPITTSGASR